jgi:NADH dehydrogenase
MNILIAGGTGFIGKHLTKQLVDSGYKVTLIRRPTSIKPYPEHENVKFLDLDPAQLITAPDSSFDVIINLVGIIREFPSKGITFNKAHFIVTRNLVDFARNSGTRRFLQMSALGVKPDTDSGYKRSKYFGEKYLSESGLDWTIFRPSVVFGPGDHLVSLFSSLIRKFPVIGVVGDGQYKLQPVHVSDVTAGYVGAITDDLAIGRVFEFGGPEIMTFDRMLDYIGEAIGITPVRKAHMPLALVKVASGMFEWSSKFPISPEQIDMLLEGNYTEDNSYYDFVKRMPIPFKIGISEYLSPAR